MKKIPAKKTQKSVPTPTGTPAQQDVKKSGKGTGSFIVGIGIRETGEPGKEVQFEITVPKGAYRFSGNR